jgi:hypothetical protein
MKTLSIDLTKKDLQNIDFVLAKVAEAIQDGFNAGIEFPVNWKLSKTDKTVAEQIAG